LWFPTVRGRQPLRPRTISAGYGRAPFCPRTRAGSRRLAHGVNGRFPRLLGPRCSKLLQRGNDSALPAPKAGRRIQPMTGQRPGGFPVFPRDPRRDLKIGGALSCKSDTSCTAKAVTSWP